MKKFRTLILCLTAFLSVSIVFAEDPQGGGTEGSIVTIDFSKAILIGNEVKKGCSNHSTDDSCRGCRELNSDENTHECKGIKDANGGDHHTEDQSFIDNKTYNFIHEAVDVAKGNQASGCAPCGASSPGNGIPQASFLRIHRFRNTTEQSSFGPGVFSSWDISLSLFKDGQGNDLVHLSDPNDLNTRRLFPQNGKFLDTFARASQGITLYKADGITGTTDVNLAHTAVLKTKTSREIKFEIFDYQGAKAGRIISVTNRNGYKILVSYQYLVTNTTVAESEKWKMTNVADETGRVISFTYLPEQRNSTWVISTVTKPDGSVITYNYNPVQNAQNPNSDERLISVDYPDGTTSTFSRSITPEGLTQVDIFEAGETGFNRSKSAYLTSNFVIYTSVDGLQHYNTASLLAVAVTKGTLNKEVTYAVHGKSATQKRVVYEGAGRVKELDLFSAQFFKESSLNTNNKFTGVKETVYNQGNRNYESSNRQGNPPVINTLTGEKFYQAYDLNKAITRKTYLDDTFEAWENNEFLQPTRYRDRLGRVTHYTYDAKGNITSKTVGLKAEPLYPVSTRINGLYCQLYAGWWSTMPDFSTLTSYEKAIVSEPDLMGLNISDLFGATYDGDLEITTGGDYTFWTSSVDGSKLYIDGQLVVDNDGLHALTEVQSATVNLSPGHHTFRVEYFVRNNTAQLSVSYQGADTSGSKIAVPYSVLSHMSTGLQEQDVTTPETATYEWRYYDATHANKYLLKEEEDAKDNVRSFTYFSNHQLKDVLEPDDTGSSQHIANSYTYDSAKRLASSTDALGRLTSFYYDSRDRLIKTVYSDGSTELNFYGTGTNANLLLKRKDRNGNTTLMNYDELGRAIEVINAYSVMNDDGTSESVNGTELQSLTKKSYLNGTPLVKAQLTNGNLTEYFYDYRHRVVRTVTHADNNSSLTQKSVYIDNKLFSSEDAYGRRTYYSYRESDTAMVRTVQGTVPSFSLADFAAVDSLPRDLNVNADYLINDYFHDVEGQTIAVEDPKGIRHETFYDYRGRTVKQINDANGLAQTSETVYDKNSNVIEVRNPRYFSELINDRTSMTYTRRNLLSSRTVAPGSAVAATESFTYYLDGRDADHSDYRGNVTTKVWKQCCGRLGVIAGPEYTDKNGYQKRTVKTIAYDQFGNTTHETVLEWDATVALPPCCYPNPDDNSTLQEVTTKYDERHRPIFRTVWLSPRGTVDDDNVPIAGQNGIPASEGLTTGMIYFDETSGHAELTPLLTELTADGISLGTDNDGSAVLTVSPAGEVSVSIQDGAGRTVASGMYDKDDYALGTYTLVSWSTLIHDNVDLTTGHLITETRSALNFSNKSFSDGAGRTVKTKDALGKDSHFEYDANSNVLSSRDANGVGMNCTFDNLNRDLSCTDTDGDTTSKTYDLNNNVLSTTDGKGITTTSVYDERNRTETLTDRINGVTEYTYDANSNVLSIKDPRGKITLYEYDERNMQLKTTYPDHVPGSVSGNSGYGIVECAYDAMGRKDLCTDQLGDTLSYNYDLASRLTSREYRLAGVTLESTDTFTYDAASRVLSAYKGRYSNTVTMTYDRIGRQKTETTTVGGKSYTVTHTYDADNRMTNCQYPSGNNVIKTYTDRNQLKTVGFNSFNIITSTYDDGMREYTRAFGNGLTTTMTYNLDNTRAAITVAGKADLSFSYTYDENKNVSSETSTGTAMSSYSFTAGFDNKDRVTQWNRSNLDNQSWTLDDNSNWQNTTGSIGGVSFNENRTHNDVNELTQMGSNNVSYDAKGNMSVDAYASNLVWDIDNHLKSHGSIDFTYDALGRRLEKKGTAKDILYISSGQRVIEEYEAQESQPYELARSYTHASYIDDIAAKIETVSELYEAEDAVINGPNVKGNNGNLPNGTYADYTFAANETITWTVNAGVSGDYDLDIRYALGNNPRSLELLIDGVYETTISFPSTASWSTWESYIQTVNLTAGSHTVQLKSIGTQGGPNIDYLRLVQHDLEVHYYHTDRQFNVRGLSDNSATPLIKELYAYTVYGKQIVMDASGSVRPGTVENNYYGFTGRYLDNETGLWYFRARYFNDEMGRFINRDPLGYVDGMSLYNGYFAQWGGLDPDGLNVKVYPSKVAMDADTSLFCGEWKPYGQGYWGKKKIREVYGEEIKSEVRLLSWEFSFLSVPGIRGGARTGAPPPAGYGPNTIAGGGTGRLPLGYVQTWMKTTYYKGHIVFAHVTTYKRSCCFSTEFAEIRGPEEKGKETVLTKNEIDYEFLNAVTGYPTTHDQNPFPGIPVVPYPTAGPGLNYW